MTQFRSVTLRVQDYALYRVLVFCILPLSTRDIAIMHPFHSFLLYALCHRLDIDISLHIFSTIIYSGGYVTSGRVHMPYCHILTSYMSSLDIDVTRGDIRYMTEFDVIGARNFSLANIHIDGEGIMTWQRGAQHQPDPDAQQEEAEQDEFFLALFPN